MTELEFAVQSLNGPSRPEPVTMLYCLIWDSPNLGGQVPAFISPQEQGGLVIPPGFGFPSRRLLRLAGLRCRYSSPPQTWRASPSIYIPQEPNAPVQNQSKKSKSGYDRRSVNHSVLLRSPRGFKGAPSERISIDIRRGTLWRNFLCYCWKGCMWSMHCNVEFAYQLSICSGTKENHGKPWSSWLVAGPSGCKLTSSQQSGIKYAGPNISSYLRLFPFFFSFENIYKFFLRTFLSVHNLDKYQIVYNTCVGNECIFAEAEVTLRLTVSQSVRLGVEPTVGLATRYWFCLKFAVLSLWSALSCLPLVCIFTKSKLLYDWQSVSQSVCLGIEHPCGTCDQMLFPVGMLLSEICSLVSR
jgi:hypothetical protein